MNSGKAATQADKPSWKWVLLPPLLIPLSWPVTAIFDPPGFPAENSVVYILIILISFIFLIVRLLIALFRLQWNRLILRPLLVIGWTFIGVGLFHEGINAVNADMQQMAEAVQQQCIANSECPAWPLNMPMDCEKTGDGRFYCIRNSLRVRGFYVRSSNETRQFILGNVYGIRTGTEWSGGTKEKLERHSID